MSKSLSDLRGLDPPALAAWLQERGEEKYRADQIVEAVHQRGARAIDDLRQLPKPLRDKLAAAFFIGGETVESRQESSDGTVKLLLRLHDGEAVEMVWIPDGERATLCLSTQVGCRMACRFCRTGAGGFTRQLTAGEITVQVAAALAAFGRVTNLVVMGMGEPLDNLDHLLPALALLVHKKAYAFSPKKITVSTVGLVAGIRRLLAEGPAVGLALSLHSALPKTRAELLPRASRFDLHDLAAALRDYGAAGRKTTIEVTLIEGLNDGAAEARAVAKFAASANAKVNLIALNPAPDLGFDPPPPERVAAYREEVRKKGVDVFLRKSRGADIMAACGQLRAGER
jgi:23S rRNA (adenine2503-C2)-methyltransferase